MTKFGHIWPNLVILHDCRKSWLHFMQSWEKIDFYTHLWRYHNRLNNVTVQIMLISTYTDLFTCWIILPIIGIQTSNVLHISVFLVIYIMYNTKILYMGIIFKDDRYTRGNHCAQSKMNFVFYYRDMKLTEKKYYRSVVDCFCPICFLLWIARKKM